VIEKFFLSRKELSINDCESGVILVGNLMILSKLKDCKINASSIALEV